MPNERSAEEIVRKKLPTACAVGNGPVFILPRRYAEAHPYNGGPLWIGEGPTRKKAYADAAARIKASETDPAPSVDAPAGQESPQFPCGTSAESPRPPQRNPLSSDS